jgi:SAM-dependent methyltransferase
VGRSIRLFRAFLREQSDPDYFYGTLAEDSAWQLAGFTRLRGARLLDVGGGPGYFADAFTAAGATYIPLDADAGELALHGRTPGPRTVQGSGMALPFRDRSFDICYSSNVLEHVPDPIAMLDEMVRVTRVGGVVFCSYTLWWGPWGGHETAPWHLLGGDRAARIYERRHGRPPKNRFGESLFAATVGQGLGWARGRPDVQILGVVPRYLPSWAAPVMRVPGLREVVAWNVALVLRRGGGQDAAGPAVQH